MCVRLWAAQKERYPRETSHTIACGRQIWCHDFAEHVSRITARRSDSQPASTQVCSAPEQRRANRESSDRLHAAWEALSTKMDAMTMSWMFLGTRRLWSRSASRHGEIDDANDDYARLAAPRSLNSAGR